MQAATTDCVNSDVSGGRWTPNSLATLVYVVVNLRINYCNTVLAGAPRTVTNKLQRVLNAAARVITDTWKFDRGLGQILHDELHWLDVPNRVFFKLAVTVHRCLNSRATPYLSDYCFRPPVSTLGSTCIPPTISCLLPVQHLLPLGLFSCRPHSLQLSP